MSRSLNKVQLIGNVGKDPDVRTVGTGGRVAEFTLATSRSWNDSGGGGRQEKTEWHRCIAWNARGGAGSGQGLADIIERYVKKGDKLFVEGSIEYRQWTDKEGQTRYTTEIRVRELIMLSPRGDAGGDVESNGRARSSDRSRATAAAPASTDFEDFPDALQDAEDDLPF